MLSKLTIVGLNEYSEGHLWDNLSLPEGFNKDVFINEVMKRGGEFSLLYPDLDFMKYQIGAWSAKWAKTFERWLAADNFEYEALWNLDVTSTRTEVGNNSATGSKTTSGTTSGSSSGSGTNEHQKAAYDSGTYQNAEKDITSNSVSSQGSNSGTESTTDSANHSITITESRSGNQGVTMSQELLDAERNVWMWNIYSHMADIFINEYCICIYL